MRGVLCWDRMRGRMEGKHKDSVNDCAGESRVGIGWAGFAVIKVVFIETLYWSLVQVIIIHHADASYPRPYAVYNTSKIIEFHKNCFIHTFL